MRDEVDDELRFHLEERAARLEREGMTPSEAKEEAERRFGNVDEIAAALAEMMTRRERAMNQSDRIDDARRDVGFATRQVFKNPGFSSVAVLTIALAIGATTAVFSVVDGIMLRPLPYEEPSELVMIWADWTAVTSCSRTSGASGSAGPASPTSGTRWPRWSTRRPSRDGGRR